MSRRRPYQGPSEAQVNAEALMRRGAPFSAASDVSFRVSWDFHRREPADLREAVRMVRKAYADEIPTKLHEGYDSIGEGGTPKMTAKAEGYIFGSAAGSDAKLGKCEGEATCREFQAHKPSCVEHGGPDPCRCVWQHHSTCPANPKNQPLVSYYHAPFRAALEQLEKGDLSERKRAAIVRHVTVGQQHAAAAAIAEGVPAWCAKTVAWDALCSFLRGLTDMKLHLPRVSDATEAVA